MVEHPLDEIPGNKHVFGEHVQQLVVHGQVPLHPKLGHLPQRRVNELHVAAPPDVALEVEVHSSGEGGLRFGGAGRAVEEVGVDER